MQILALDTSTEYCSVALWQDGEVISHCELVGQKHSEILMPMLDKQLHEAGVKVADLNGIAFGMGPGSFTGVRIACGVAQGLALGANLPVVGICTLEALAEGAGKPKVIAALDARMSEVYHAAYIKQNDVWMNASEPFLCKPDDAPPLEGKDWFGAGSGFATHGEQLKLQYTNNLKGVDETAIPQAAAIAMLGAARFAAREGVDAAQALPLYLRNKVALKTSEREAR